MNKYPAPALERGLHILNLLATEGDMKLEELTKLTGLPKASVNRYLKTLVLTGYIKRDAETKKFHTTCSIERNFGGMDSLKCRLPDIMKQLVDKTGLTAEWYEYKKHHAVITERVEPENVAVKVLASKGFYRLLDHEFEAVSKLFICNLGVRTPMPPYFYRKWDEVIKLTESEVIKELEEIKTEHITVDKNFNHNGIRRCAATIFDSHNRFLGVLALAGHYHPSSNKVLKKGVELLKEKIEELKTIL